MRCKWLGGERWGRVYHVLVTVTFASTFSLIAASRSSTKRSSGGAECHSAFLVRHVPDLARGTQDHFRRERGCGELRKLVRSHLRDSQLTQSLLRRGDRLSGTNIPPQVARAARSWATSRLVRRVEHARRRGMVKRWLWCRREIKIPILPQLAHVMGRLRALA